jgi:hypothetical protein
MKSRCLTLLFTLMVVALAAQKKDPQAEYDWSKYDFSVHYTLKNGGGKKIFADNKRLFITNFQIGQLTLATGKQVGSSNLAKMSVSITPIDVKAYQALVDKLYQQMVERLTAEGYTLVSDEEVANSAFAKKEHNGKSILFQYAKEPWFGKDGNGNEVGYFWPTNKFIGVNTNSITGTWPSRYGKSLDANIVSVVLTVSPVSFDGDRSAGYRKGASIEAQANMTVSPWCYATNERGGFGVWGSAVDGKDNWVGPKGMYKTDSSTDVFGGVRGTYVLDINQDVYLSEVEALAGGMARGFVNALMKEVK